MKTFLLQLCRFFLFLAPFYIVLVILWGTIVPGYYIQNLNYREGGTGFMQSRLREADTTKDIDILCLGSSHSYRGFDPRIFAQKGYRMFNLGSSSQTPVETEYLLNKYLARFHPRFIIVDAYPAVFQSDGVESLIDLITNGTTDSHLLSLSLKLNSITAYNTLIYSRYRHLSGKNRKKEKEVNADGDAYISGGFVQSFKKYKTENKIKAVTYNFDDRQLHAFEQIISTIKSSHTNYVIVQTPVTQKRYNAVQNNDDINSRFSKYGSYYNFNKLLSLPDSCFYDNHHLNQSGVNIYNEKLLALLAANHRLP